MHRETTECGDLPGPSAKLDCLSLVEQSGSIDHLRDRGHEQRHGMVCKSDAEIVSGNKRASDSSDEDDVAPFIPKHRRHWHRTSPSLGLEDEDEPSNKQGCNDTANSSCKDTCGLDEGAATLLRQSYSNPHVSRPAKHSRRRRKCDAAKSNASGHTNHVRGRSYLVRAYPCPELHAKLTKIHVAAGAITEPQPSLESSKAK